MQFIARQNERRMDERIAQMEALMSQKKEASNVDPNPSDGAAGSAGELKNGGAGSASGEKSAVVGEPAGDTEEDAAG